MLRRLVGYAAYMFGANTITGLLTFAVSALGMVTRPKEAFGDYAVYMRIYEIGQGIFIFGANASIQRFAADNDESRMRFSAMAFWGFFVLLVVMSASGIAVGLGLRWNYAFALFGLPWLILYWWARYIVRSKLDARREARLMMIASLSNSVYQFVFLTFTDYRDALIYGDFLALVTSGVFAAVFIAGGMGSPVFKILKTKIPVQFIKEAFRFAIPLWWSGQIFQAKHQVQGIWTRAGLGPAPMGALQGAQTMWQFAAKPLEYLSQAALPGLVTAKDDRRTLYEEILRLCLVGFTLIGLVVAAGMPAIFLVIDHASSLFGRTGDPLAIKYAEVPTLLRIFALGTPLVAFEIVTNQYCVASGRQNIVLYANIANVIAVAGSLYPLTMSYGLAGVIGSGMIGELATVIAFSTLINKELRSEVLRGVASALLASACCLVALVPVHVYRDWTWNWSIAFPAVAVYVVGMFMFRLLSIEDFRRVQRAYLSRSRSG